MQKIRFTLVELLVVIAIIAVLASFLVPALMKAHEEAKFTACMNNLKQFGTAISSYQVDFENKTPMWLSSLVNDLGGSAELYQCPFDEAAGKEGSRPDWVKTGGAHTYGIQFPETNDMPVQSTLDEAALNSWMGAGANTTKRNNYADYARPDIVKSCSYMYEFSGEWCSWYNGDYASSAPAGPEAGATWNEVKEYESRHLESNMRSRVPLIRCMYHIEASDNGELLEEDNRHRRVLNLGIGMDVFISQPKKWWR